MSFIERTYDWCRFRNTFANRSKFVAAQPFVKTQLREFGKGLRLCWYRTSIYKRIITRRHGRVSIGWQGSTSYAAWRAQEVRVGVISMTLRLDITLRLETISISGYYDFFFEMASRKNLKLRWHREYRAALRLRWEYSRLDVEMALKSRFQQ